MTTPPTVPTLTQTDIAGLVAVAEFLDQLGIETDAPDQLRNLAERLAPFVPLPSDA